MLRVAILGANGQLGTDLSLEFATPEVKLILLTRRKIDICDSSQVTHVLTSVRPDVLINTAAFHKVEACEENIVKAFEVNCYAVRHLAQECNRLNILLVHFSTDYVFDGNQKLPYREDDHLNPLNVYGVSKAGGEFFLRHLCPKHLLIRSSGLYGLKGSSGKGGNFVETMLRLGQEKRAVTVVTDQVLAPTFTKDLAAMVRKLVEHRATGVFHVTNSGSCSWYEFAKAIFANLSLPVELHPCTTEHSGSKVPRPSYSVLDNYRLQREGFKPLRRWQEALAAYLNMRKSRKNDEPA